MRMQENGSVKTAPEWKMMNTIDNLVSVSDQLGLLDCHREKGS